MRPAHCMQKEMMDDDDDDVMSLWLPGKRIPSHVSRDSLLQGAGVLEPLSAAS